MLRKLLHLRYDGTAAAGYKWLALLAPTIVG